MKKIESKTLVFNIGPDIKSNISVIKLIKKIKEKNKKIKINYHFKKIKFNETKILHSKFFKPSITLGKDSLSFLAGIMSVKSFINFIFE